MFKNDRFISSGCAGLAAAVVFGAVLSVASPALARTDGVIVIPPKTATASQNVTISSEATPGTTASSSSDTAVDLTDLIKTIDEDDNTAEDSAALKVTTDDAATEDTAQNTP